MADEENKGLHEIAKEVGLHPKTTTLGLGENVEGALCYLLWFISGILFLIIEKDNKFVRFHALQSIATFLPLYIIVSEIRDIIYIPTIGMNFFVLPILAILSILIWMLITILWLLLIYKASRGEKYKLPIVGRIAERYA